MYAPNLQKLTSISTRRIIARDLDQCIKEIQNKITLMLTISWSVGWQSGSISAAVVGGRLTDGFLYPEKERNRKRLAHVEIDTND